MPRLRDLPSWPPGGAASTPAPVGRPRGEVGTLHDAEDTSADMILVVIALEDGTTTASVQPVRAALRHQVLKVLRAHVGRPVAEVGGRRVSRDAAGLATASSGRH
jgi:hypothetical protein